MDNDGHFDLLAGNFSHPPEWQDRPKFYRNRGPVGGYRFEDRSGTVALGWQESFASPSLADSANADLKTVLGSPALMTVVAEYFTSDMEEKMDGVMGDMEPILTLVITGFVAVFVLAVFLPMIEGMTTMM